MKLFNYIALCIALATVTTTAAPQALTGDENTIGISSLTGRQNRVIASKYFIRGLHYNNIDRPDFASLFYEKAYQYDTSSTFLILELAKLYAQQSQYLKSLETYTKAYANLKNPTSSQEQFYGYLYQFNNKTDSAKIHYSLSIQKDSSNVEALYQYSIILEETKSYDELRAIYSLFIPQIQFPENYVERLSLLNTIYGDSTANVSLYTEAWEQTGTESFGFQLANLLSKQGNNEKSIEILIDLIGLNPENKNALYETSRIYIENGDFSSAAPYLYKLYALDTTNITYLQKLAQLEYEINDLDSSLKHFKIVTEKDPKNDLSFYYMSSIYAVSKDLENAISNIEKSISLKPSSLLYKNHLATLYYTDKQWNAGFVIIDTLIAQNPDKLRPLEYKISALKYKILSLTEEPRNDTLIAPLKEEIISLLLSIHKSDPLNTDLLFEIAASFERIKKFEQCEQYFSKLLALDSNNHAAMNYLGYTLIEQNIDLPRGNALIDKALSFEPKNIAYLDSKIWYYYLEGNYKKALEYINRVPKGSVHDEIIFEHFAQVYHKLSLIDKEKECWIEVLSIAPESKNAHHFFIQNKIPLPKNTAPLKDQ
ncbi:MAG: tetratricopeptide repeat protein [Fibrobacterales bacterium]